MAIPLFPSSYLPFVGRIIFHAKLSPTLYFFPFFADLREIGKGGERNVCECVSGLSRKIEEKNI